MANEVRDNEAYKWLNENDLSYQIWDKKYRYNNETFEEWLDRVSAKNEKIKELIRAKKFIFGGRILSNRGLNKLGKKITLSNCYVITPPEDNIESIFECAAKLARTYSYGGGCGTDVSKLRPKGAKVNNAAKSTSGCTSFMDFFSYVTGLIGQEGRRGALMLSIDCTHPDLEEFINLKSDLNICTKANISVKVTDEFMYAVAYNKPWKLSFDNNGEIIEKIVNARDIFNLLAKRNWEMAEPGILYWDNICNYNMIHNHPDFQYVSVNPCAEEPLPSGGSCLLASLNLAEFVENPFTNNPFIKYDSLVEATKQAIIAMNDVLDEGLSLHPLQEQRDAVENWRQIGLGTLGLGDMLIKLGIKYGSEDSLLFISRIYHIIATTAVMTSVQLAKEKGKFKFCNNDLIIESNFIKHLDLNEAQLTEIRKYGLRNSQLLTCAPTGSISTLLQVSSGVEPNYAFVYNRKTISLNNKEEVHKVYANIVNQYRQIHTDETLSNYLPDYFVNAYDIAPIDRIKVQATLQEYIDASISSTINLPESATIEQVFDIYFKAWENKLKGVTIYRDNCQRTPILSTGDKKNSVNQSEQPILNNIQAYKRDTFGEALQGETYKKHTACGNLYITINKDSNGNIIEIFTNSSRGGTCKANLNGETRMISTALRSGVKVDDIIDSLNKIQCQSCIYAKAKGTKIDGTSCPDIIARCIKASYKKSNTKPNIKQEETQEIDNNVCPNCGNKLTHTGGCVQCDSCGYSKCN